MGGRPVTYGKWGKLVSVEVTEAGTGHTFTVIDGKTHKDIREFGEQLVKAYAEGDEVTLVSKDGDLQTLSRNKEPEPTPEGDLSQER